MPADYNSTARALALPVSPPRSPSQSRPSVHPPWSHRRRTSHSNSRSQSSLQRDMGLRDKVVYNMEKLGRQTLKRFTPLQLALASVVGVVAIVVTVLFFIFHEKFFAWLSPTAVKWKNLRGGWCILWAMTFATAFPPILGYSTCMTIAGFVYGLGEG